MNSNCQYKGENEQRIIEQGVSAINCARKENRLINLVFGGLAFVFLVLMLVWLPVSTELENIRKYTGIRPAFETVEARIMNSLFKVEYVHDTVGSDTFMTPDDSQSALFAKLMSGHYEFTKVKDAADYDYSKLDLSSNKFKQHSNEYIHPDLKETDMYREAAEEAKTLFEAEMNKRDALAKPLIRNARLITGLLVALYMVIAYFAMKSCKKNGEKHLDYIRGGQITLLPAVMTGRKLFRSRNGNKMSIEVRTEDGQNLDIKVCQIQYDRYKAGEKVCVIIYPDQDSENRLYDLVWNGMVE